MPNPSGVVERDRRLSPLDAFTGVIVPARPGLLYKTGLAVVAFAMVLLPAIYVALIGLTAWGVYYHLTHNTWIVGASGAIFRIIIYIGPAVVGAILVFFMVKPLFARARKETEPVTLDPAQEPLLFGFVEKICAQVRAPVPSRIDVDCQVNAFASLRHGLWSKDLVLTIGMPLVVGLDLQQFGGVLAHEFGHFAQGAGLRLTYVIRKINFWFARVVYERDVWDMKLDRSARSADYRIRLVLEIARGCVWLTRRILWALMQAGHAVSCFMLRQMEYDADSYEAKLAGSDAFESTATRLPVLNIALQFALEDVRRSWTSSRLAENLPLLVDHKVTSLKADIQQQLVASRSSTKTRWFDTHPCDADRIRAAQCLNESGIFRLTEPATTLFADFPALSKAVTRHQYEKQFGLEFADENLIPTEEILRESATSAEAEAVVRRFYGGINVSLQALLVECDWPPVIDYQRSVAEWREKLRAFEGLREEAERISIAWNEQQSRLISATAAHYLAKALFRVDPKEFGLPENAETIASQDIAAQSLITQAQNNTSTQIAALDPFITVLRQRVTLALRLAVATANDTSPDIAIEIQTLAPLLVAVSTEMPCVYEIGTKLRAATLLAQNRPNHPNPAKVDRVGSELASEMRTLIARIQERLKRFPYPFEHARGQLNVAVYLHSGTSAGSDWQSACREADETIDRLFALHYRLLGKLLAHANTTEEPLRAQETPPK